ncbi:MAG: glutamate synthase subunit alpha, partial [Actinobacteria bacterium]|nr:glutamate synthase subunit alpha [Actinomycetota bacterium]
MSVTILSASPSAQGLYRPEYEHDACGVAWVATLTGEHRHDIVQKALTALRNLDHRGASGAEINSGDGAGILTQIPDEFFRAITNFSLPTAGQYAAGIAFMPKDVVAQNNARESIEKIAQEEDLEVIGWRILPIDSSDVGPTALEVMPFFEQLFVAGRNGETGIDLDRKAFALRKRAEHEAKVYFPSLSSRTIVYKGMLTTGQLEPFFPDLSDPRFTSAIGLVHSRFSTNT